MILACPTCGWDDQPEPIRGGMFDGIAPDPDILRALSGTPAACPHCGAALVAVPQ